MRLEPIAPADLNDEQRTLYDDMRAGIAKGFNAFETERPDGTMIGPWKASLHFPAIGRASWDLTKATYALSALPPEAIELVILLVGGFHRADYEIYAHDLAAERLGMSLEKRASLVANVKPAGLTPDENAAFDMAYALCRGGPVPAPIWRFAVERFGERGAAQLVYLVGSYALVAITLNGFAIAAPGSDSGD